MAGRKRGVSKRPKRHKIFRHGVVCGKGHQIFPIRSISATSRHGRRVGERELSSVHPRIQPVLEDLSGLARSRAFGDSGAFRRIACKRRPGRDTGVKQNELEQRRFQSGQADHPGVLKTGWRSDGHPARWRSAAASVFVLHVIDDPTKAARNLRLLARLLLRSPISYRARSRARDRREDPASPGLARAGTNCTFQLKSSAGR